MGRFIEQGNQREKVIIKPNGKPTSSHIIADVFKGRLDYRQPPLRSEGKLPVDSFWENHLLADLFKENLLTILPFLESVALSAGEYVYQPDDQIDYLYFPETAVISEFQILEDGRTVEVAMIGREGIVGLLPLFAAQRAANWTQVSISGNAFRINGQILKNIMFQQQAFQILLLKYIGAYVGQLSHRAVCNSCHNLEERFCGWLTMLQNRKKSSKLSLTQEQIARSLGVHRPSVTHIAQDLRTKKIIDYVRGRIIILDRSKLEEAACSCNAEIDKSFAEFFAELPIIN